MVGDTGVKPQFDADAVIDLKSGRMYWVVAPENERSYIAEVNLTTGKATPLYTLPDDALIKGLVIESTGAYDKAPAAVTNASADFVGGSFTGTVSFTTPSTHFDGTPASGEVTATVAANGTPVASKKVRFGQNVTMDVTVANAGLYNFDITLKNTEGISPKTTIANVFVGNGTPLAPQPVLVYADGQMTLSWEPVTQGADGGYVNPSDVTYSVVRFPDNVEVASNTKATTFTENIPEPASVIRYHYTVKATYAGLSSSAAESNSVLVGSITPPYTEDFDNGIGLFTVLNFNNDAFEWQCLESWTAGLTDHGNFMRLNTYLASATDSWLLTPPMHLETGNAYKLRFFVITSTQNDETLEVKMGEGFDVADLTTVVLEPTVMRYGKGGEIECTIVAKKTGRYTIGFHALSPPESFYIAIDDISISEPYSSHVPKPVSDLQATAAELGALSATISCNAPTQAIDDTPVGSIKSVDVYRNNSSEPVKTFTNPTAGQPLSFVDKVDAEGTYTYTVTATCADGTSNPVSTSVFVGTGIPNAPENVRFTRTATHGEVVLSWDPVKSNTHNQSIDPANVKYNIYTTNGYVTNELVKGVSASSYKYQAVPEGEQAFMQYVVEPYTSAGVGQSSVSNNDPVGKPYDSMHESGNLDYTLTTSGAGGMWIRTDSEDLKVPSQDGDHMVYALAGESIGDSGTIITGLVSLSAMTTPGITFYIYSMGEDDTNEMKVCVIDPVAGTRTQVCDIVLNTLPEMHRWNKIMIPLDAFAGKTIQVSFDGCLNHYTWLLIDNISVDNLLDHDLAVEEFSAPTHAAAGAKFPATVTIRNEGMKSVDNYRVEIVSGAEIIATLPGIHVESNRKVDHVFDINMDVLATKPLEITPRVIYDADQNPANNIGKTVSVAPTASHMPAPRDLSAKWENNNAILSWDAPDYADGVAQEYTEDFETAEGWAHEFGEWQFIDVDQSPVGGLVGFTTPGVDYSITTSSFYVFDTEYEQSDESFVTHSGTKMLVSLFCFDNSLVDDWAVSPVLDGMAQTISFYARSYHPDYPETIEVYYTTVDGGEFDKDDYTLCATFTRIAADYIEYTADIPAGAKHFAIRSCAKGAYMLQLDDVTFYPDADRVSVELLGYDIYRDGVKLNSSLLKGTSYSDPNVAADAPYRYHVVAVYDKGTSAFSNAASLVESGVEQISASDIDIAADNGIITVSGAEGQRVAICAADGKAYFAGVAPDVLKVAVPSGIYVVKAGATICKVAVR